jgi:putative acetyltransferase
LTIRKAQLTDLGELTKLFRDSILKSGIPHYSAEQLNAWSERSQDASRWEGLINDQFTLLIENANEILGFASLRGKDYFDFLYVTYDQQGKGLAKQLYQAIIAEAKIRGASKVSSDVSFMARPFFEARGFKVIKTNENIVDGETLINFRVEKSI